MATLTAALAAATLLGTAPTHADVPLPPLPQPPASPRDLGPQPYMPAPACSFPVLGATQMVRVFADPVASELYGTPQVEPDDPCHVFRTSVRNGSAEVLRGDLVGGSMTWNETYVVPTDAAHDSSPAPNPQVTAMAVAAHGRVVVVTGGVSGADPSRMVASDDHGATWSATDADLVPVDGPPVTGKTLLAVAPSDPRMELVGLPGDHMLHLTSDGGRTWSVLPLPSTVGNTQVVADAQFDPSDARHIYLVVNGNDVASSILESHDRGATWSALPALTGPLAAARHLVVTDRGRGTLYLGTPDAGEDLGLAAVTVGTTWWRSRDDGVSWTQVTDPMPGETLVADPADPSTLVWVGEPTPSRLVLAATTDDFATPPRLRSTFDVPAGSTFTFPQLLAGSLSADRAGDFFLSRSVLTANNYSDDLIAFRATAIGSPSSTSTSAASVPSSLPPAAPPQQPAPPPVPAAGDLVQCNLASVALPIATSGLSNDQSAEYPAGSITFDGRYLDYTQDQLVPGVIFRMGTNCAAAAPLRLHPEDFPNGKLPAIFQLAYAPDLRLPSGTVGAILAAGDRTNPTLPANQTPVYAVDPVSARASLLFALDTATNNGSSSQAASPGDPFFSYDFVRRGLWTFGAAPGGSFNGVRLGFQPIAGGPLQTNCMSDFADQFYGFGGANTPNHTPTLEVATWAVGGDGIMYVQMEDDKSVYRVDDRTCQVLGGFQHRLFSESGNENEQMACDPVTFGPGSPSASGGEGFSVLWIRDSQPNKVSAYRIPDGYCPFPTRLAYTGATVAAGGATVPICFALESMSAGTQQPLANQRVSMTINGMDIGSGVTDAAGRICRPAVTPLAGGAYLATARFAGNNAYLPSSAEGTVMVLPMSGHVVAGLLPPSTAGTVPPQPGPQANAQGTEPATSASASEAQAQAQSQAQSQAQTQSVAQGQPGLAIQRQRRAQVAIQTQAPSTSVGYHASRLRRGQSPVMVPLAMLLILGLGTVARQRRMALARVKWPAHAPRVPRERRGAARPR